MPSSSGEHEGISCPKMTHVLNDCRECYDNVVSFSLPLTCTGAQKDCTTSVQWVDVFVQDSIKFGSIIGCQWETLLKYPVQQ